MARIPTCHPERRHQALDLCHQCYGKAYYRAGGPVPHKEAKWQKTEEHRQAQRRTLNTQSVTPKATKSPTIRDLERAAGFMEGEGSFSGNDRVAAFQVNREPLDRLVALFGGKITEVIRTSPSSSGWQWYTSGARARGVAMTLYLLLSEKRRAQIKVMLNGNRG